MFPPRYAGMEGDWGDVCPQIGGFPRATRGWKDLARARSQAAVVSPALRGDGRGTGLSDFSHRMFPPRYAGMEDHAAQHHASVGRFPRATRGWKGTAAADCRPPVVSPALRGDGRASPPAPGLLSVFPPRYAGMEGRRSSGRATTMGFPRATRGWKQIPLPERKAKPVSPALRGDGREGHRSQRVCI